MSEERETGLHRSADVLIIGGGIVGVSTAYYLAQMGVRRVLLLERGLLGEGSTIRSAGIIRGPFSTEINCRFGLESLRLFGGLAEETGTAIDYHEVGYLAPCSSSEDLPRMAAAVELQQQVGLRSSLLKPDEIREVAPFLRTEDLAGAIYAPDGGYASQHEVVAGLARGARAKGAVLRTETPCAGLLLEGGRVAGARTPHGEVRADVTVLAAGVWSRELAAQVGVDLPVFSSRSHIVLMHPQGELPRPMPVISDYAGSFYTRPELGKLLVGLSNSEEPVSYRTDVDWEFIYTTLHSVIWRMPFIEQAGIGIAWAGLIEYTPDKHPVIGPVPEVEGLIICAGFSGHGFMHGPVAGRLVAELITAGAARTIDITPLDIRRFDRNPPAGLAPIRELLSYTRKAILDYRRGRSQG